MQKKEKEKQVFWYPKHFEFFSTTNNLSYLQPSIVLKLLILTLFFSPSTFPEQCKVPITVRRTEIPLQIQNAFSSGNEISQFRYVQAHI